MARSVWNVAQFEPAYVSVAASLYRELFWETGIIGQALYLGAEAAGVRATASVVSSTIVLHRALGLKTRLAKPLSLTWTLATPPGTAPPYPQARGRRDVT